MPYEPDELEEIKSLLEHSVTNPERADGASEPGSSGQADRLAPGAAEADGGVSGEEIDLLPAVEAAIRPSIRPKALPPATTRTGPPATTRTGPPATTRTGPPATTRTGPPATTRTGPPATTRTGPPATTRAGPPATTRTGSTAMQKRPASESIAARRDAIDARIIDDDDAPGADNARDDDIAQSAPDERGAPELDAGSEKFKVKFDFDGVYRDVPEDRPLRLRREKRTGCVGGILYAAFVICVSLVLASLVWMGAVDVLGFGAESEQVNVTVKQGFTMDDITDMLYDAGLVRYKFLFNIYAGYSNAEDKISPGQYVLDMSFDYRALVQGMTARAGERVEVTVPIPEGFTLAQIFARLVDYGVCQTEDELWETAKKHDFKYSFLDSSTLGDEHRLEGFLFPETYNFYLDSTPVQAISKFLNEFNRRFTEQYTERAEILGYTVREVITIASMIEREAGSDEDRAKIASVIHNRLNSDNFPNLQIDATIYYAIAGTGRPFSTDVDSPYNTYLREGLPPGPIANPGVASIRAALYPESSDDYYYALNKQGTHNFFRTLEQHRAFVESDEYGG